MPSICILSRKHAMCGETKRPVRKPDAWSARATFMHTEPLPLVPATCTTVLTWSSGRWRLLWSWWIFSKPILTRKYKFAEYNCRTRSLYLVIVVGVGVVGVVLGSEFGEKWWERIKNTHGIYYNTFSSNDRMYCHANETETDNSAQTFTNSC